MPPLTDTAPSLYIETSAPIRHIADHILQITNAGRKLKAAYGKFEGPDSVVHMVWEHDPNPREITPEAHEDIWQGIRDIIAPREEAC